MKTKKFCIILCILIFTAGIIVSLWLLLCPHGQTVNIIQNGKILYTIDLSQAENQTIEVEYQGNRNIIQIQNHQICIIDAECPDHTCVKMGYLKSNAPPIVCLPNKLVISFAESGKTDAEVK